MWTAIWGLLPWNMPAKQPTSTIFPSSKQQCPNYKMPEPDRYTSRVIWSEEDEEYVGLCAEFPSLSWLDESPEAALHGIRQLVADVVTNLAS